MNNLSREGYSKTVAFGHGSNHISRGQCIPKYLSYEADLFCQNAQKFVLIAKLLKNFPHIFPTVERIAFESLAEISLISDENTCDRQSTCYQTVISFLDLTKRDIFHLNLS